MIQLLCFDADDTLWHNERFFRMTQDHFANLLADYADRDHLDERLLAAERRNLGHYGFGIKGFMLSMIETALDVTENRAPGHVIRAIVEAGQDMLAHPIELLPDVQATLEGLAPDFTMVVVTKGDLLDQERKLAQSGLGDLFDGVEIVSQKIPGTYSAIFRKYGARPEAAVMSGNSLKSDVNPAIRAGGWGVYVPHGLSWEIEHDTAPEGNPRYAEAVSLADLPGLIQGFSARDPS